MTFGEKLRAFRESQGLTKSEFCEKYGVGLVASLSIYERNKRVAKLRTVKRFADACGLRLVDLLSDEDLAIILEVKENAKSEV